MKTNGLVLTMVVTIASLVACGTKPQKTEQTEPLEERGDLITYISVSDTTMALFALGNLQYQPSTHLWRFAKPSYAVLGTRLDDEKSADDAWVDLFSWRENFTAWGKQFLDSVDGEYWRMLSKDEWWFMLKQRQNADGLWSQAIVDNVCGWVILPDNYPSFNTTRWTPRAESLGVNVYTATQWENMENDGALFLPAIQSANNQALGAYWTSTKEGNNTYYLDFIGSDVTLKSGSTTLPLSVHLARDL